MKTEIDRHLESEIHSGSKASQRNNFKEWAAHKSSEEKQEEKQKGQ